MSAGSDTRNSTEYVVLATSLLRSLVIVYLVSAVVNGGGNDRNHTNTYRSPLLCVTSFDLTPSELALALLATAGFCDLKRSVSSSSEQEVERSRKVPIAHVQGHHLDVDT